MTPTSLTDPCTRQALLRGLYEIVPKDLLQIFSERELELLISGLPEVEVEDWQANTSAFSCLLAPYGSSRRN